LNNHNPLALVLKIGNMGIVHDGNYHTMET
jgi:hypothetical protein